MTERDRVYYEMITVAYPLGAEYQELSGIKRLADKGYCKADEVRKETLKNLFSSVSSFINFSVQFLGSELPVIRLNDLKDIIKSEFGVEVEE